MLFENKLIHKISLVIFFIFIIIVLIMIYKSFFIVKNQFIDIDGKTYVNQVRTDEYTKKLAKSLVEGCDSSQCEVQSILNLVTNIPYKINKSVARSSKKVIEQNYGDCDDKSNLLISLLKVRHYEAYFVLVPKHIFVIVHLKEKIPNKKVLYINKKAFYILESTATNSKIGYPLRYKFSQIESIIDPFKNKKLVVNSLTYK